MPFVSIFEFGALKASFNSILRVLFKVQVVRSRTIEAMQKNNECLERMVEQQFQKTRTLEHRIHSMEDSYCKYIVERTQSKENISKRRPDYAGFSYDKYKVFQIYLSDASLPPGELTQMNINKIKRYFSEEGM